MADKIIFPEEYATDPYMNLLVKASEKTEKSRILMGIPVTGLVRIEWAMARWGQIIPCNWSQADHIYPLSPVYPIGYNVMDARNVIVNQAVTQDFQWLFFLDHDVILPPHTLMVLNEYMRTGEYPIVTGVYFTRSDPAEPLLYRGRGTSYFREWQIGDTFWVDGCGCGCLLLSVKLLAEMWKDAPEYLAGGNQRVKKVFDTPQFQWMDPETGGIQGYQGTEDLSFLNRVREGNYLAKSGFKKIAKKKYFVYVDSGLFCYHIGQDGTRYPKELKW